MNLKQPKPQAEYPPTPPHLSPVARKAWREICDILYRIGVLTSADGLAVRGLAEAYADRQAARAALAEHDGLTYMSGSGVWRTYPEVAIANESDRRLRMWLAAVGLSPSDRSRVTVVDRATGDDFSEFLN